MKRLEIKIFGFVQGISYRVFIGDTALRLDIIGTVKNMNDGSVFVVAEGPEKNLGLFLAEIKSYKYAKFDNVDERWGEKTGEFSDFNILK